MNHAHLFSRAALVVAAIGLASSLEACAMQAEPERTGSEADAVMKGGNPTGGSSSGGSSSGGYSEPKTYDCGGQMISCAADYSGTSNFPVSNAPSGCTLGAAIAPGGIAIACPAATAVPATIYCPQLGPKLVPVPQTSWTTAPADYGSGYVVFLGSQSDCSNNCTYRADGSIAFCAYPSPSACSGSGCGALHF